MPKAPTGDANHTSDSGHDSGDEALTYEQARTELEQVVRNLDNPDLPLDDMMALWERGEVLASRCEALLDGARSRFDEVTRTVDQ